MLYDMGPFTADKEIVMAAVMNDGTAIQFASPELQEDMDVAMVAVMNNGSAILYLPELQRNPTIIKLAMNHGHKPTREQQAIVAREQEVILAREQSSMALHQLDAESAPFREFEQGVRANLEARYASLNINSTVGKLNDQGPDISNKIMNKISAFGLPAPDRAPFPGENPKGGTRRKRNKRTKRTKQKNKR